MNTFNANASSEERSSLDELNALTDNLTNEATAARTIKEESSDSVINFNTLGSILNDPTTPHSQVISDVSSPALNYTDRESSIATEVPNRFNHNSFNQQADNSGYIGNEDFGTGYQAGK